MMQVRRVWCGRKGRSGRAGAGKDCRVGENLDRCTLGLDVHLARGVQTDVDGSLEKGLLVMPEDYDRLMGT